MIMKKELTNNQIISQTIALWLVVFAFFALLWVASMKDDNNMTEYGGEPGECTIAYLNEK